MRFIEKISNFAFPLNAKHSKAALLAALLITGVSGCSDDDDEATPTGYLKLYNVSSNSPAVYLTIDDNDYTSIDFGESAGLYEINTGSYEFELSYKEDEDDFTLINENDDSATLTIGDGVVDLVVVSGSIEAPVITTFEYADENPDEDTDEFALRLLNTHDDSVGVYISADDETFAEAELLATLSTLTLSDSLYQTTDSYKFYISSDGGATADYESESIYFPYTTQYVITVRENTGPGDSPYTIDRLSKSIGAVEYSDVESVAEVRVYNGLSQHADLASYADQLDLDVIADGVTTNIATALNKGEFSSTLTLDANDYALYLTATGDSDYLTENNRFFNLEKNSDKTVFLYTDEVNNYTSDGDNDDTTYEVEAVVRTLVESNSNNISLLDHTIKVINFVDDFPLLGIYFVKSDESFEDATTSLTSSFANTKTVTVSNNTYDILIIASSNDETVRLDSVTYTFDETTGDQFMIIEEDDASTSGYKVTFASANN